MAEVVAEKRGSFSGKLGFIMAAAGSAVGLGNLWRFPWLASHYGGGLFVILYIVLAITFGLSLMIAEVALGRRTGKSCVSAFGDLKKKYKWMGMVIALIPLLIVPYYCVIGGWVTKWFAETVTGSLSSLDGDFFGSYISGDIAGIGDPIIWFAVFAGLTVLCVVIGVNKGVEKLSKILLPMLLVMMVAVSIYELATIDNIGAGVDFYLNPDLSDLNGGTLLGAISQIFYSLSLAMGIMITYGSYMKKKDNIEVCAGSICLLDTIVAIIAGLMIIPASFAILGADGAGAHGMGLMFTTLPQVFMDMPGGEFVAPVFYLLVIFAAVTSSISLLETVTSVVADEMKVKRKIAIAISSVMLFVIGILTVLSFGPLSFDLGAYTQGAGLLGFLDTSTNSILMPIAAILTCVFVGYIIGPKTITDEVEAEGQPFRLKKIFVPMIKYVCPICLAAILVFGLLDMFGIFTVY